MYFSGRITVRATVAGSQDSAWLDVIVTPRDWSSKRVTLDILEDQIAAIPCRAGRDGERTLEW